MSVDAVGSGKDGGGKLDVSLENVVLELLYRFIVTQPATRLNRGPTGMASPHYNMAISQSGHLSVEQ